MTVKSVGLAFHHTSTRTCLCPVNNEWTHEDNKSPRIWDYGATSYRNAVSGAPLGWLDDSPRAYNTCLTDQRGIPNRHTHIHLQAGLANKAITGLIWMFDFQRVSASFMLENDQLSMG